MVIRVTCRELPILIRQLKLADPELAKQMKREIRQAERPAVLAMQQSAAGADMMKAARAVKVSNRFTGKTASLGLKVDARIAPNARPLDHPNRGAFNRHRVFGHPWMVDQPARPFFNRGSVGAFDACEKGMNNAFDSWVRFLAAG
jgi:hypothetical protein